MQRIVPRRFGDKRDFFAETYSARDYALLGVDVAFVQDNHSVSSDVNTIWGLHFQASPHAQPKLVRCGRRYSARQPHIRALGGFTLSAENGAQLHIPAGFAHGFATLVPDSEIIYKCSDYYAPETEGALRWDDPDIGIEWPLTGAPVVSDKDASAPLLADFHSPFTFEG